MKQLIFLAILSSACLYGAAQQIKQKPVPKEKKELPYYDPSTMSKNGGQGYQDTFSVDHILFRIIHHDSLYDGIVQKKERGKWTEVLRFENLGNHNDYFINKDLNNDGYPDICLEWKWDMETFFYNPQQKTFLKQSVWLPHEWYLLDQAKGIYCNYQETKTADASSELYTIRHFTKVVLAHIEFTARADDNQIVDKAILYKEKTKPRQLKLDDDFDYIAWWKKNYQQLL